MARLCHLLLKLGLPEKKLFLPSIPTTFTQTAENAEIARPAN